MIEWVNNLSTFRQILNNIYKQRDGIMTIRELRLASCKMTDSVERKKEVFTKVLQKRHPAVFGEWFRECFTNPHNWYQARSSYIKTTAVMSIVGYMLGLGDRHGENILFDASNGDAVHVDFNCLFNKGEGFEYPELVPFRLTHNMTMAMGPLGVEGLFRKCCEITLRVMQSQTPTLMSVVRPFVYDPLVGSGKPMVKNDVNTERERADKNSLKNIQRIEQRLKGYVS
jgi:serine/threonine-protein kinase ATR